MQESQKAQVCLLFRLPAVQSGTGSPYISVETFSSQRLHQLLKQYRSLYCKSILYHMYMTNCRKCDLFKLFKVNFAADGRQ